MSDQTQPAASPPLPDGPCLVVWVEQSYDEKQQRWFACANLPEAATMVYQLQTSTDKHMTVSGIQVYRVQPLTIDVQRSIVAKVCDADGNEWTTDVPDEIVR